MTDDLRKRIASAIFDPGQTQGYKGDLDLTTWQIDAVMAALESTTPVSSSGGPIAYTSQTQLDQMAEAPGDNFVMWGEPLPHHHDIPLYAAPFPLTAKMSGIECNPEPVIYRGKAFGTFISPRAYLEENHKDRWEPLYRALSATATEDLPVSSLSGRPDLVDRVAKAIAFRRMKKGLPLELTEGAEFLTAFEKQWAGVTDLDERQRAEYRMDAVAALSATATEGE